MSLRSLMKDTIQILSTSEEAEPVVDEYGDVTFEEAGVETLCILSFVGSSEDETTGRRTNNWSVICGPEVRVQFNSKVTWETEEDQHHEAIVEGEPNKMRRAGGGFSHLEFTLLESLP